MSCEAFPYNVGSSLQGEYRANLLAKATVKGFLAFRRRLATLVEYVLIVDILI